MKEKIEKLSLNYLVYITIQNLDGKIGKDIRLILRPRLHATKNAGLAEWKNDREICVRLKVPSSGVK